jgi:hypothetical protein
MKILTIFSKIILSEFSDRRLKSKIISTSRYRIRLFCDIIKSKPLWKAFKNIVAISKGKSHQFESVSLSKSILFLRFPFFFFFKKRKDCLFVSISTSLQ